ncbi:MAG: hypothetical protein ACSHX0_11180 [Akkermansiaceae bacterium]
MSTASLVYTEFDSNSNSLKSLASSLAETGRSNGHQFGTYVPVDGDGHAVTVTLHEEGSADESGAELVELHTRQHETTGLKALSSEPKKDISALHSRTAKLTSYGPECSPKPYAIALSVTYDRSSASDITRAGHAITAAHPDFRFHVIRRAGAEGHAMVVIPVDSLDELDAPASDKSKPMVDLLAEHITSTSVVRLRRLADYSCN